MEFGVLVLWILMIYLGAFDIVFYKIPIQLYDYDYICCLIASSIVEICHQI
jgi:hypothetical protein